MAWCRQWLRKQISTQVKLGTLLWVQFWHLAPKELVNVGWQHFMLVSLVFVLTPANFPFSLFYFFFRIHVLYLYSFSCLIIFC